MTIRDMESGQCRHVGGGINVYCRAPLVEVDGPYGRKAWNRGPCTFVVWTAEKDRQHAAGLLPGPRDIESQIGLEQAEAEIESILNPVGGNP